MIIAIDGPAAAGKGTLARRLAAALNLPYLDTGLLYRAVGRLVLDQNGDPADPKTAIAAAKRLDPHDLQRDDLRGGTADKAASQVASIPGVRAALLDYQRHYGNNFGAVLDGRDIGTIVFPNADIKLFVDASLDARAARRYAELLTKNAHVTFDSVRDEVAARDEADRNRSAAPLIPAPDAIIFDTTHMDPDMAFQRALDVIFEKRQAARS